MASEKYGVGLPFEVMYAFWPCALLVEICDCLMISVHSDPANA